jgi:hypothetical protein
MSKNSFVYGDRDSMNQTHRFINRTENARRSEYVHRKLV